ncbi:unnamed protein product, partial [Durusdinium trenchii]
HIKLPRGKEGTKEILVAKLRNAQRVSRKINKVLQKDVEEAEADGRSQRLEIATAIRPAKSGEM